MYYTKKLKIKKGIVLRRLVLQISLFLCVFGIGIFYFVPPAMAVVTSPTDCGDQVPQTFDANGFPTSYARVKCECGDHLVSSYTMRNEDEDIDCSGVADSIGLQIDKTWRLNTDEYRLYAGPTSGDDNDSSNPLTLDCNGHKIIGKSAVGKAGIQNVCFQSGFSNGEYVYYYCRDYYTVKNCTVSGFETGIKIDPKFDTFQSRVIRVENNTIYNSKIGIDADLTHGTTNYITNNDVLDNDGGPGMLLKRVGCAGVYCSVTSDVVIGVIANNRVITRNSEYAVKIYSAIQANIYGNYFDCNDTATCLGDLYMPFYVTADWLRPEGTQSIYSVGMYDNVFGGYGFKTAGSGFTTSPAAVRWCQKLVATYNDGQRIGSNFVSDTAKNIRNIFRDVGTMNKPAGCDTQNNTGKYEGCNAVDTGATCSKTCIGSGYIAAPYDITENTCFYNQSVHVAGVTTEIGFTIKNPNVILDCNQAQNNRRTYGYNTSDIAIRVDGSSRNSIIGCALSQFQGGIQLKNSEDVLLRENIVENIHYATGFTQNYQDFFYQVISDPDEDPKHYNHKIYNRYLDTATCIASPGDASCAYRIATLNKISKTYDWSVDARQVVYINHPDDNLTLNGSQAIWGTYVPYVGVGHLTIVNAHGIDMKNFTIDEGDPITLFDIRSNTASFDDVSSNTVRNNYRDSTSFSDGFRIINSDSSSLQLNFHDNTAETNNIGFSFASSTGVYIFDNIGTNNMVGIRASDSEWLKIYGNTLSSNKTGSWGGRFYQLAYTEIGSAFDFDAYYGTGSVKTNRFNENNVGGLYYEGNNFTGNTRRKEDQIEFNFIMQNEISSNGFFGLVMTYASSTRVIGNNINNNGVNDNPAGPSYSPGFYINQSHNLIVRKNTIDSNSGDNLYIDSSSMPSGGKCISSGPDKARDNPPRQTTQNSFLSNIITNSIHGSGVFIDADSCVQTDPEYAPSVAGKIYKNYFGFFYLFPTEDPLYYDVTPGIDPSVYNPAYPTYGPEVHGELLKKNRVIDWDDQSLTDRPVWGSNTISNNYENGITLSWNKIPTGNNFGKIRENDFYKNTISGNGKIWSNIHGNLNGISILGVTDDGAIYSNDIIDNDIINSYNSGIYINYGRLTKIFANDISGLNEGLIDSMWGVNIDHSSTDILKYSTQYNQIGNFKQFAALPYKNTIHHNSIGINLSYDYGTRIDSNDIYNFDVAGIAGHSSGLDDNNHAGGIYVDNNTIYNGIGNEGFPTGIFIGSSENWQLINNKIYAIDEANKVGQYLYVGPEKQSFVYREWANNLNNYYPQASAKTKSYYNHTIGTSNMAGPTNDTALRSIRYYNNVSSLTLSSVDTYHLQAANSSNISLTGFVPKSGADPLEIDFYSIGNLDGNGATLSNCRGECIILYGVKDVTLENIVIASATRSGIKGFYLDGVTLDSITIQNGVNSKSYWENGGMYFYDSVDNIIINNNFTYKPATIAEAWPYQKFELFFGGGSMRNVIENNTFGSTGTGTGAYEQRAEYDTEVYFNTGWSGAEASYLKRRDDYMCYVPLNGDTESDGGNCDPNCTNAQDYDCNALVCDGGSFPWPDCCNNTDDNPISDLQDCLLSIQNNFNGESHPIALTCHNNDDGCCVRDSYDDVCDPNCPLESDQNCNLLKEAYGGGFVCPNSSLKDDPSETAENCCNGLADDVCDYDCPRGFDPDCVSNNSWCQNPANKNSFVNIDATLQKPNYYDLTVPAAQVPGGGGIPNGAYYCYAPRMQFGSITQGYIGGYRKLSLSDRNTYRYRFAVDLKFADREGLGLRATIKTSDTANGTFGPTTRAAYFYNLASPNNITAFISPASVTIPVISNTILDYSFGATAGYILTPDKNSYPTPSENLWSDPTRYDAIGKAIWYPYNVSSWAKTIDNEDRYARIEAINVASKKGQTYQTPGVDYTQDQDLLFFYDMLPSRKAWAGEPIITMIRDASYPYKYKLSWVPATVAEEASWTPGKAHYEIWYGENIDEVKIRQNTVGGDGNAGPYVWDDLSSHTGTALPYLNCTGADFATCADGNNCEATNYCYDSKLSQRDCGRAGGCYTIVDLPSLTAAGGGTFDLPISQDAYVQDTAPNTVNNSTVLNVDGLGDVQKALMQFDVSSVSSCTVTDASLIVNITNTTPSNYRVYDIPSTLAWNENNATWCSFHGGCTYSFQDGVNGYAGTKDLNIKQKWPTTNFNSDTNLCVDYNGDGCQYYLVPTPNDNNQINRVLIQWDTSAVPTDCAVTAASITINNNVTNGDSAHRFGVYSLRRNWTETTASWNNYDGSAGWTAAGANDTALDRYPTDLMDGNSDGGWGRGTPLGTLTFDFDTDGINVVQSWVNNTLNNYGVIIKDHDTTDTNAFIWRTRLYGTLAERPKLDITCASKAATDNGVSLTDTDFALNPPLGPYTLALNAAGKTVVQNWITTPATNKGFLIKAVDTGDSDKLGWDSSEGTVPPVLQVTCAGSGGSGWSNVFFNACIVDDFGNEKCSSVQEIKPWVETKYGDIYSRGDITGDIITTRDVATFLIRSERTIGTAWASACSVEGSTPAGMSDCKETVLSADAISFPDKSNKYTISSLGSLDFLNKPINASPSFGYQDFNTVLNDLRNRYGAHRVVLASSFTNSTPLGGKIFYNNGVATVSTLFSISSGNTLTFTQGAAGINGSGLIIINGNLAIDRNIAYGPSSSGVGISLTNIPSVTWIVLGDISINDAVTNIEGAYIALGKPGVTSGAGSGIINTGTKSSTGGLKDVKLTVNGLLFARKFEFVRNLASQTEGAEVIIYDGRLQANPPPGLEDFIKNLPVWK